MLNSFCRHLLGLGLLLGLLPSAALAICDVDYVVQPGDNLFSIAETHYGDRERWTMIYYRNQDVLVGSSVVPGRKLQIPCIKQATAPDATPLRRQEAEMTLLTGGGYAPFTDRGLPGQGMVTELVNAALELAPSPVSYAINWEDDWSKHLFPMLDQKEFDMGFPWYKPDCAAEPDNERCVNFHFSEPVMALPIMLFVRVQDQFVYAEDRDIEGKTLCRPKGYFTHDLNRQGRRWLDDGKITLVQPQSPADCFRMVSEGQVDAVAVNLFLGASTIVREGLRDTVLPLEKPLSEEGLHVVISKRHWRGTSHLYRINAGLKKLRDSGRFEEIMSRHLELFWAQLQ
ncbi:MULTISPECIES: transporter substrate-binding domain-containing protein [unclassified Leisingera]|uniref:transporter substrate-binding domain-containing protein n=1 Tax=unclassified Leisingera TaxID=2614906 RepID=UPI0010136956|nr:MULTISPECIES: transporter substrate-binding domain-containing protein [unclassified Leisingera]MBQ4825346.1 transporter substrate-binding domain-containing protein [Leisingera sp. HS039]MCF6432148.1 transporter substrate-binding domain-containing protein [Leisingera sp. MMG026]QAX30547.1 transporter substrate-binding domain-containing protein [Leisingera sp. NJS204]QBR35485.1 transporter substrate-binding domain-containing protein [Leisingera sp. NJS201]